MTNGQWICKKCGHKIKCHISDFFEKCPKCNIEYEKLAIIYGFHVAHSIIFYKLKEESIEEWQMIEPFAFARNTSITPTVMCYSKKYYEAIKSDNKYNHLKIEMVK